MKQGNIVLGICLMLFSLSSLPIHAQQKKVTQRSQLPYFFSALISVTLYLPKMPAVWPKTVPYPKKVAHVTEGGHHQVAVTWDTVPLWNALPPVQKKRIKRAGELERYYANILYSALKR